MRGGRFSAIAAGGVASAEWPVSLKLPTFWDGAAELLLWSAAKDGSRPVAPIQGNLIERLPVVPKQTHKLEARRSLVDWSQLSFDQYACNLKFSLKSGPH